MDNQIAPLSDSPRRVGLLLLKPSRYDDDGYVIEWAKVFMPSHVVSVVDGLFQDINQRQLLGPSITVETRYIEEQTHQVFFPELCQWLDGFDYAAVLLVGVQTSQYLRGVDLGRMFRQRGYPVIMGGFHVSGSMAMVPDWSPALSDAKDAGISLFAGELESHAETLVRDIMAGEVKPLYNMLSVTADLSKAPMASYNEDVAKGTLQNVTGLDTGRGCPFVCSFCTIINVHGRSIRHRDPADIERYVRYWVARGRYQFLIVDDNFSRSPIWRDVTALLAQVQKDTGVELDIFIQIDTLATRVKGFVDACVAAGIKRVFIGMESVRTDNLAAASKGHNKVHQMRDMLLAWKQAGVIIYAGYIIGFPADTRERVMQDMETLQNDLPIDILELSIMTPFPGSEDQQGLVRQGIDVDLDFNFYDASHTMTDHPLMSRAELDTLYWDAIDHYYSKAHRKTLLGRALYYGMPVEEVRRSIIGFYGASHYDRVHSADAGFLRIYRRRQRRAGLPVESSMAFYRRALRRTAYSAAGYLSLMVSMGITEKVLKVKKRFLNLDAYTLPLSDGDPEIYRPTAAE